MDFISPILGWIEVGWDIMKPFYIIYEWEAGVLLRRGVYRKTLWKGWHWKLPFFEEVQTCIIATETIPTNSQSLMTADNISIFVSGAVKCRIDDPEAYIIKVKDVTNAISDLAQWAIKTEITKRTFEQCRQDDIDNEISKKLRHKAKDWGVHVESVIITTFDKGKTIRLIQS